MLFFHGNDLFDELKISLQFNKCNFNFFILIDSTVCVKCETTAFIPSLDYRCRGDGGTEGMITRWSLFSEPYCYGKWQRTVKTGSECDASVCQPKPHFIFV